MTTYYYRFSIFRVERRGEERGRIGNGDERVIPTYGALETNSLHGGR